MLGSQICIVFHISLFFSATEVQQRDSSKSGDSSDSDVVQRRDASVMKVVRKLQKKMKKQDKVIEQQDKWIREQRQQHSKIQDKVASLEDQSSNCR